MNIKKLVLIALIACVGVAVFGQTNDTAGITLTGVVQEKVEVTVTAESGSSSLDLTTNQTDLKVATVTEYCNMAGGYTLDIQTSTASASPSFYSPTTTQELVYSVKYDGNVVTFDSNGLADDVSSGTQTTSGALSKDLTISYSGSSAALTAASDYSDTLTFTITSP